MTKQAGQYRVAADIGGTFTDVVLLAPSGNYWTKKVSSTPQDYGEGIAAAIIQILTDNSVSNSAVDEIVHGTTVATNTVLESKGAKTGLITTKGFRDVLEMRRLRVPSLYSLLYDPPKPLVKRRWRMEVNERISADGEVLVPLDESSLGLVIDRFQEEDVQTIAVSLLHSYRYQQHERRVGDLIRQAIPDAFVTLSVDVLPEIREYERTSTTVINAYLGPTVKHYIDSLVSRAQCAGIDAPIRIMQSNGGIMSARTAAETPVQMLESGPAAGVVAAHELGMRLGIGNIISFDMGGTTAKAALIENGEVSFTTEYEVGSGISLSSQLIKGGGHAVKVPVIDLAEVGAGGGSIVWVDPGGALKVGPQSAGASPGPACYAAGGRDATVTDANVVLGYINPRQLVGGEVSLQPELACSSVREIAADPLGMSLHDAAYGIHTVANVTMIRAIRAVSTSRGRDPRDFAMVVFGGSGPIHAANMAREMSISTVIVPPAPGVFSAVGLLEARPEHHFVQTFITPVSNIDLEAINEALNVMVKRASISLAEDGYGVDQVRWTRQLDIRYIGQAHELTVRTHASFIDSLGMEKMVESFHSDHDRTYGHQAPEEPVEVVNLRLSARSTVGNVMPLRSLDDRSSDEAVRDAYFGPLQGILSTPVVGRGSLTSDSRDGPIIIEEYDATTVVPPGCTVEIDAENNMVIKVGSDE